MSSASGALGEDLSEVVILVTNEEFHQTKSRNYQREGVLKRGCKLTALSMLDLSAVVATFERHEFHETCHSITFIVLVNSHQR